MKKLVIASRDYESEGCEPVIHIKKGKVYTVVQEGKNRKGETIYMLAEIPSRVTIIETGKSVQGGWPSDMFEEIPRQYLKPKGVFRANGNVFEVVGSPGSHGPTREFKP